MEFLTVNEMLEGLKKLADNGKGDYIIECAYCTGVVHPDKWEENDKHKTVIVG